MFPWPVTSRWILASSPRRARASKFLQKDDSLWPFAEAAGAIDVPARADGDQTAAPCAGKRLRARLRDVRVVRAGDDDAGKWEPLKRHRGEPGRPCRVGRRFPPCSVA